MSVPNLKPIAQFVENLLSGSQYLEIRSRDPGQRISKTYTATEPDKFRGL